MTGSQSANLYCDENEYNDLTMQGMLIHYLIWIVMIA